MGQLRTETLARPLRAATRWRATPASRARERALRTELARLTHELAAMGAHKVVVFGSVARDQVTEESDLDLLVVMDTADRFVERSVKLAESLKPRVAVDFLVYTPDEFESMRRRPFVARALAEGHVLNAADA